MSCPETLGLIHEVLDRTASEETTARLREHLRHCESCAREWEALASVDELLRTAEEAPSAAYFDEMAAAIRFETQRRSRRPVLVWRPAWSLTAVAAAACLLLGLGVGHVALPRTVVRTETLVRPVQVQVPGPVREVVVTREVEVPVPVVPPQTRTVARRVPAASVAARPAPSPRPAVRPVALTTAPPPPAPEPACSTVGLGHGSYGVVYAVERRPPAVPHVTAREVRLLASRLRADMADSAPAAGASDLATTLATGMDEAGADMEHALAADDSPTPSQ